MTKNIVSYDLANHLKESGFNEPCLDRYICGIPVENKRLEVQGYYINDKIERNMITAPTYQQVLDWLREKHNLCIYVFPLSPSSRTECQNWEAGLCYVDSAVDATVNACGHIYGETYYDCLETAIGYCLHYCFKKLVVN